MSRLGLDVLRSQTHADKARTEPASLRRKQRDEFAHDPWQRQRTQRVRLFDLLVHLPLYRLRRPAADDTTDRKSVV